MDAVGVGARVGLLLRREDLALPDGVHGGVPVLAPLRHGGDVHEGDGHPRRRRPGDVGRHLEHVPVRPQPYRPTPVHQRHRLLRAPDAVRVSPHLRAVFQTKNQSSPSTTTKPFFAFYFILLQEEQDQLTIINYQN